MRIAFIGFGEAARAFGDSLAARDANIVFGAYDILLDSEGEGGACASAMRERDVAQAFGPHEAIADADWIISAVTADRSLEASKSVDGAVKAGQIFIDINSVSPARKIESARIVEANGASYLDMAVMAPVHPRGHQTPVLLGGSVDATFEARLRDLDFDFETVGPKPGDATAIKMVRSLFVKGLEAITVETLLAAQASGCLERVLGSLRSSYPGLELDKLGPYHFERTLKHGKRRAAEMRESAATLNDLGLGGVLADAIADIQQAMGDLPADQLEGEALDAQLQQLVALRRGG